MGGREPRLCGRQKAASHKMESSSICRGHASTSGMSQRNEMSTRALPFRCTNKPPKQPSALSRGVKSEKKPTR
jgi:hypothetical protein